MQQRATGWHWIHGCCSAGWPLFSGPERERKVTQELNCGQTKQTYWEERWRGSERKTEEDREWRIDFLRFTVLKGLAELSAFTAGSDERRKYWCALIKMLLQHHCFFLFYSSCKHAADDCKCSVFQLKEHPQRLVTATICDFLERSRAGLKTYWGVKAQT